MEQRSDGTEADRSPTWHLGSAFVRRSDEGPRRCRAPVGLAVAVIGTAILASAASLVGVGSGDPAASSAATAQIPPSMLTLYQQAAASCPGLSWTILAAIGTMESDNGQSNLPGVHSGGMLGGRRGLCRSSRRPLQSMTSRSLPAERSRRALTTRRTLSTRRSGSSCANGGAGGADVSGAVYAYNHSAAYVSEVLALAQTYAGAATVSVQVAVTAGAVAVRGRFSIGTPYVWGGETPGVGFDCSGLVQAAYAAAGVLFPGWPRTSTTQRRSSPQGRHWSRVTSCSSAAGRIKCPRRLYVGVVGGQDVMSMLRTLAPTLRRALFCDRGVVLWELLYVRATRPIYGRRPPLPHVAGGCANAILFESIAVLRGAATGATEGRQRRRGSVVRDRGEGPNGTTRG